jgi:hypothetical protein
MTMSEYRKLWGLNITIKNALSYDPANPEKFLHILKSTEKDKKTSSHFVKAREALLGRNRV